MAELPPPQIGAEEARDLADQVLSGRAYLEASRPPSLQERLFDWIAEVFADLFNALSTTGGRGFIAWLVIGVFGALITFLIFRLFRGVGTLPIQRTSEAPAIDVMGEQSAEQWMTAAAEAEAAGDWRVGIRCRHRALVTTLIRQGVVTARPGQTAGEIQRLVSENRPAADTAIQEATWLFKDTWYGWIDADTSTRDRFVELAAQVLTAAAAEQQSVTA